MPRLVNTFELDSLMSEDKSTSAKDILLAYANDDVDFLVGAKEKFDSIFDDLIAKYSNIFSDEEKNKILQRRKQEAENADGNVAQEAQEVQESPSTEENAQQETGAAGGVEYLDDEMETPENTEGQAEGVGGTEEQTGDVLVLSAQDIRDAYASGNRDLIEGIFREYVAGKLDVADREALALFGDLILAYGARDGNGLLTEEYAVRALAKYESDALKLEHQFNSADDQRIYSLMSDKNQVIFDKVTFEVYSHMGLIPDDIKVNDLTPVQVYNQISEVSSKLTEAQRQQAAALFVDGVVTNPDWFRLTPPNILTDAYLFAKEQYVRDPNNKKNQDRFHLLAARIDKLILDFKNKVDYYYADPSNIADVYAGYNKMCDVRAKDLVEADKDNDVTKLYKQQLQNAVNVTKSSLAAIMGTYVEYFNLREGLTPDKAQELDERWHAIVKNLQNIELNEETLATISKFQFLDENKNPVPQFLDENGKESLEYKPGYKVKPDSQLAMMIRLTKNTVTMRNLGLLDKKVEELDLENALNEQVPWTATEVAVADQIFQKIAGDPKQMLTEEGVQNFWNKVKTDGATISAPGFESFKDAHVNQVAAFAGILAQKVGNDKPVVMNPLHAVEDVDKLAKTRIEKEGAAGRKQKVGVLKRMLKNFGMATAVSAGLTIIGKATGISYIGAAIGTTLGIGNMVYQGFKWRKEQKRLGKKPEEYGIKAFFSDKRNWGPALATGLGAAATICMATGNPALATGLGIGAMTAGGTSSAVMTYKDMMRAGNSRGKSLLGALGIAGSVIAGGFFGRWAGGQVVDYVNNNTDSNLFKHEEIRTTTTETQHTVYDQNAIQHHEEMMIRNGWETQASFDAKIDNLMDSGLGHDEAVRYLLAWHDTTSHNLGNGYFYGEHGIGMDPSALEALRNSINPNTNMVNVTPESMAAFEHFNPHISELNQVGSLPQEVLGRNHEYTLPPNAEYGLDGSVIAGGNEFYETYANHNGAPFHIETEIIPHSESIFNTNELLYPAMGTFGIYEPRVLPTGYIERLRERVGSLADKVGVKLKNQENSGSGNDTPTQPVHGGDTPTQPVQGGDTPTQPIHGGDTPTQPVNGGDTPTQPGQGGDTPTQPVNGGGTPGQDNPDKPKRGFWGWLKDGVYEVLKTGKNAIEKVGMGILDLNHKFKKKKSANKHDRDMQKQQQEEEKKMKALETQYKELKKETEILYKLLNEKLEKRMKYNQKQLDAYKKLLNLPDGEELDFEKLKALKANLSEIEKSDLMDEQSVLALWNTKEKLQEILAEEHEIKAHVRVDNAKAERDKNAFDNASDVSRAIGDFNIVADGTDYEKATQNLDGQFRALGTKDAEEEARKIQAEAAEIRAQTDKYGDEQQKVVEKNKTGIDKVRGFGNKVKEFFGGNSGIVTEGDKANAQNKTELYNLKTDEENAKQGTVEAGTLTIEKLNAAVELMQKSSMSVEQQNEVIAKMLSSMLNTTNNMQ